MPVAFVSLLIALAVAVPLEDEPKAVALSGKVATAVPGDAIVPVNRKTRLPDVPISAVTAFVAASLADVECVTAIYFSYQFIFFDFSRLFTGDLNGKP